MSIELLVPRYAHRRVSDDEKFERKIANPLDPADTLPQECGVCHAKSSWPDNPLMMKPYFTMDGTRRPKGELYRALCAHCMEREAGKR